MKQNKKKDERVIDHQEECFKIIDQLKCLAIDKNTDKNFMNQKLRNIYKKKLTGLNKQNKIDFYLKKDKQNT